MRMTRTSWLERWRRWPHWVGHVTFGWAVAYGGFGLVCALTRTPVFFWGTDPGPVGLDWVVVALGGLAAACTMPTARSGSRPVVRALLWGTCGLSLVCAFGLLMNVITLIVSQTVDNRAAATGQALAAVGAVLLAATARSRRSAGCPGCGGPRACAAGPRPSRAPRTVRRIAYAGASAFVPYAVMKTTWALGGTFAGRSGAEVLAIAERNGASGLWLTLESWGLDVTALLAVLGVFLIFGLIRPWGQRLPRWTPWLGGCSVPRWLLLAPALLGAATLAPYGIAGVCYAALGTVGVVTVPRGDFPSSADTLLVTWVGLGAFGVYGVALIVAARFYWLRTRAACPTAKP